APAPAPRPAPPIRPADACGAAEAQTYVGRLRTEIPVPVLPALQRVACTTCPVTLDFNPRRLNFFYDAETGIIKEVRCG
ncbi:peptidase inhibitor I78, partial [Phenylobacterium conjunctum]